MMKLSARNIALALGTFSLALILGALGFQYLGKVLPCEMCHWQRWPHIAAATIGILGAGLIAQDIIPQRYAYLIAWLTLLLVASSGALGVFHAGVEWQWWKGPTACTGSAFSGPMDLNAPVVRCDVAAWRFLGLSLAGYNAIFSLCLSAVGAGLLLRLRKKGG